MSLPIAAVLAFWCLLMAPSVLYLWCSPGADPLPDSVDTTLPEEHTA